MTDKEALLAYRLREAEETLADARTILDVGGSTRTVINRSYYAMFYGVLALFIQEGTDIRTSKHAGVIGLFDREFVHTGKFPVEYSRMLHRLFDARQESDYKEFIQYSPEEARKFFEMAETFLGGVREFLGVR
jgi:uncharacterized protein (UPF0332 family)